MFLQNQLSAGAALPAPPPCGCGHVVGTLQGEFVYEPRPGEMWTGSWPQDCSTWGWWAGGGSGGFRSWGHEEARAPAVLPADLLGSAVQSLPCLIPRPVGLPPGFCRQGTRARGQKKPRACERGAGGPNTRSCFASTLCNGRQCHPHFTDGAPQGEATSLE